MIAEDTVQGQSTEHDTGSTETNIGASSGGAAPAKPLLSKAATVRKLLARSRGVTIDEIFVATGWKPHSVRAFLSGVRKSGATLLRETRKDGSTSYRATLTAAAKGGEHA